MIKLWLLRIPSLHKMHGFVVVNLTVDVDADAYVGDVVVQSCCC